MAGATSRAGASLIAAAIGASAPYSGAQAAGPHVTAIAGYVESVPAPRSAVDANGGAVVTWTQSTYVGEGTSSRSANTVFAAIRPAGGRVGPALRISDPWLGMRSYALAVGSRGSGAIIWQSDTVRTGQLFVHRLQPGHGRFGRQVAVPGSRGASEPAAAIDARGRLMVAWLRASNRDRCGMAVYAGVASPDGRFGRARRVSGTCAHAGLVRAALARNGDGAVAWRSAGVRGPLSDSHVVIAAYAAGRFTAARTVSTVPRIGFTLDLAAGGRRALAVWRDRGTGPETGVRGRVVTSAIDGERVGPPVVVHATPERMLDDVDAAMNAHDVAIVCWEQAPKVSFEARDTRGLASIRPSALVPFGSAEVVVTDRESSGGDLDLRVALDRAGRAIAIYSGTYVERRPAGGTWSRRLRLRRDEPFDRGPDGGSFGAQGEIGLSDGGEAVASWLLGTDDAWYVRAGVIALDRSRG